MRILHSADVHLSKVGDERWQALKELLSAGKREKIDLLIISGDLFDLDVDAEMLRPDIRELFSNNNFEILIVPGNHDKNSYSPSLYFGENVKVLNQKPYSAIEYPDARLIGFPFEDIDDDELIAKIRSLSEVCLPNRKNILIFHGELLDSFYSPDDFGGEGTRRYMPVRLSYFSGLGLDYVLAGHFHSRFDVRKIGDESYFIYPGSPVSISRRETGERKANIFDVGHVPKEYSLSTMYYCDLKIRIDPFKNGNLEELIDGELSLVPDNAKLLLEISGYADSNEVELKKMIDKTIKIRKISIENFSFLVRDVGRIFQSDLYRSFEDRLKVSEHDEDMKAEILNMAIKAMMETDI
ncbi:MAG: metallophosphoesterase [Actinobacteria bacterium]|nr:metallophosphoesterase [Actinomycetota bacterium]